MNCIMIDDSIPKIFNVIIASDLDNDSIDYHQNFASGLNALKDNIHSKVTPYPQKPFEMTSAEKNSEDKLKSSEETIKERSRIIHQMLNRK